MLTALVADRPEELLHHLVARLSEPAADPFAAEWVSVPSVGVRTWLQLALGRSLGATGRGDGVAANISMPLPGSLRWTVLRAHRGVPAGAAVEDPWQVDRLVWSVLEVLAEQGPELDDRLGEHGGPSGVPLAGRAGPIADLLDRYSVHRPWMLLDWAEGADVGADGAALPERHRWQPRLYRAVRDHVRLRHGIADTPAERLLGAIDRLRSGDLAVADPATGWLPPRLFVFGQSMVTADVPPLLSALGEHRDVTLLLLSPSAVCSERLARAVAADPPLAPRRGTWSFSRAQAAGTPNDPLLAGWGARPLETAKLLGAASVVPAAVPAPGDAPSSLLEHLQASLRADDPTPVPGAVLHDGSIQVHAAPGRARQVEVLRDAVLGLLRDHPDLHESDVLVLCPQLEQYAPVIGAVLGAPADPGEPVPPGRLPALRYTVVDRSARAFNPVLDAMAAVLDVLPGRFDGASVRDLLHAPAVRERFGLDAGDLALLAEWAELACVRWGLDGPQRERWGIDPTYRGNTWAAGVDQMLMGLALGDDLRLAPEPGTDTESATSPHALAVGGVLPTPLDDGALFGAGRLAAAVRSLGRAHQLLVAGGPRPVAQWCADLRAAADLLVAPVRFEEWQRTRFDEAVEALAVASAGADGAPSPLAVTFADVRRLLAPALEGARIRTDLGHGTMVFARPALLAGVPAPVVCVLGLDDDALPVGAPGGDDLGAAHEMVGDRDPRAEARAEMLAAITGARRHLLVTCVSRDVRTNAEVEPSVLLQELAERIGLLVGQPAARVLDPSEGLRRVHPRQAFHPSNFTAGPDQPTFGFDPVALAGAEALRVLPEQPPSSTVLVDHPLDDIVDPAAPVELGDLRRFVSHPVKHFFRSRLNVTVPAETSPGESQLPTGIGAMGQWDIGSQLLEVGVDAVRATDVLVDAETGRAAPGVAEVVAGLQARGVLPPRAGSAPALAQLSEEVLTLLQAADGMGVRRRARETHQVDVSLPDGTRLVGAVTGCVDGPHPGPVRLRFSRFKPQALAALAIDLLALTLVDPTVAWHGVLVTRAKGNAKSPVWFHRRVVGDGPDERAAAAGAALAALVAQARDGLRAPLPLFDKTSYALHTGASPSSPWGDPKGDPFGQESQDPYHVMAFGSLALDDMLALTAAGHTPRGEAARLWGTLLGALETVEAAS